MPYCCAFPTKPFPSTSLTLGLAGGEMGICCAVEDEARDQKQWEREAGNESAYLFLQKKDDETTDGIFMYTGI